METSCCCLSMGRFGIFSTKKARTIIVLLIWFFLFLAMGCTIITIIPPTDNWYEPPPNAPLLGYWGRATIVSNIKHVVRRRIIETPARIKEPKLKEASFSGGRALGRRRRPRKMRGVSAISTCEFSAFYGATGMEWYYDFCPEMKVVTDLTKGHPRGKWSDWFEKMSFKYHDRDDPKCYTRQCYLLSWPMQFGLIATILFQVLVWFATLQRCTEYGDVNCQKFWALVCVVLATIALKVSFISFYVCSIYIASSPPLRKGNYKTSAMSGANQVFDIWEMETQMERFTFDYTFYTSPAAVGCLYIAGILHLFLKSPFRNMNKDYENLEDYMEAATSQNDKIFMTEPMGASKSSSTAPTASTSLQESFQESSKACSLPSPSNFSRNSDVNTARGSNTDVVLGAPVPVKNPNLTSRGSVNSQRSRVSELINSLLVGSSRKSCSSAGPLKHSDSQNSTGLGHSEDAASQEMLKKVKRQSELEREEEEKERQQREILKENTIENMFIPDVPVQSKRRSDESMIDVAYDVIDIEDGVDDDTSNPSGRCSNHAAVIFPRTPRKLSPHLREMKCEDAQARGHRRGGDGSPRNPRGLDTGVEFYHSSKTAETMRRPRPACSSFDQSPEVPPHAFERAVSAPLGSGNSRRRQSPRKGRPGDMSPRKQGRQPGDLTPPKSGDRRRDGRDDMSPRKGGGRVRTPPSDRKRPGEITPPNRIRHPSMGEMNPSGGPSGRLETTSSTITPPRRVRGPPGGGSLGGVPPPNEPSSYRSRAYSNDYARGCGGGTSALTAVGPPALSGFYADKAGGSRTSPWRRRDDEGRPGGRLTPVGGVSGGNGGGGSGGPRRGQGSADRTPTGGRTPPGQRRMKTGDTSPGGSHRPPRPPPRSHAGSL